MMSKKQINEAAKKVSKKKTRLTLLKIILLIILLFLVNIYIILGLIYRGENFTITLDSEYGKESGLIIYENPNNKRHKSYLRSKDIDYFTDISVNWLPKNIDSEANGSHNGENYIAYTFYAENEGEDTINYWTTIEIDDVIKNVDDAIRVMLIKNGERVIYAKESAVTGAAEPGTVPFDSDKVVMLEQNKQFKYGDVDKYTVVIWVEGDDRECLDHLIGGEIKMHMRLTEEHIQQEE